VEQCRGIAEHNRQVLHCARRKLAMGDEEVPAQDDLLASPRFAYFNERTSEQLRAMQQEARITLKRYEEALRLGTTVLTEREQQTSS
jgi:hypothetical protein